MSLEAKNIREDIARSRAAAQKNDLLRTLEYLRDAAWGVTTLQVYGREKFEIEALFVEALKDLNRLKTMKKVMPKGLSYRRGNEKQLHATLSRLHSKLEQAIEKARIQRERQRMAALDTLLVGAQNQLKEKNEMEARKLFRKAAEEFKDIPGILSDIGTRMAMGGLVSEAVEYLVRSIDMNSRDNRAHQSLIMCYEGLGELAKAEDAVGNAIKFLGPSEPRFIKLANIAMARTEWDTAMHAAERVLKNNPLSVEAKKIAAKCRPKVYRSSTSAIDLSGNGKASTQAAKKPNPAKTIKLDF
ncbi:MAG: hypothetical protein KKB70_05745 [Proteobacteria bacterium]|nr:hypothetical protein [Pseudomonadota bacterium]